MYTLLILAVLTSFTVTSSASPLHPPSTLLLLTGRSANSSRGGYTMTDDRQPRPDDSGEPAQRIIRRRSLNLPDPDKPKINRLLKVNRNRFLEVTQDGHVVATTSSNSVYSKLEVKFMCESFPEQFRPCPLLSPSGRLPDQSDGETLDEDQRSTYSAVLLRFTESNRYLCIDDSANIYTKPDASTATGEPVDISECVFQHEFLPNQYDVYSSYKYPRNTTRCLRQRQRNRDPVSSGRASARLGGKGRYCDKRWYIGVSRKAEVLTVRGSGAPSQKAFFIQRWVYDQPSQTSPQFNVNPHREATRPTNNTNVGSNSSSSSSGGSGSKQQNIDTSRRPPKTSHPRVPPAVEPPRVRSRRPVYRFLTRPSSSLFGRRVRAEKHRKAECGGNLLKNCDDDGDVGDNEGVEEVGHDETRHAHPFAHRSPKRRRAHRRKTTMT